MASERGGWWWSGQGKEEGEDVGVEALEASSQPVECWVFFGRGEHDEITRTMDQYATETNTSSKHKSLSLCLYSLLHACVQYMTVTRTYASKSNAEANYIQIKPASYIITRPPYSQPHHLRVLARVSNFQIPPTSEVACCLFPVSFMRVGYMRSAISQGLAWPQQTASRGV